MLKPFCFSCKEALCIDFITMLTMIYPCLRTFIKSLLSYPRAPVRKPFSTFIKGGKSRMTSGKQQDNRTLLTVHLF
tara:strand:+ start:1174 stop:1401 length:228 start_codon:yes stop_codon:yes gene_type:complete